MQKLDSFSKILIATGQINYMAASIDSVNQQMKFIPDEKNVHAGGIEARDILLEQTVKKLTEVMNDLGEIINAHDCICAIDVRVSKVPFEILIEGKDDTDNDYEDDE